MRTLCLLVLLGVFPIAALSQILPGAAYKADTNLLRKTSPSLKQNKTGNWMVAVDNINRFKKEFAGLEILQERPYANVLVIRVSSLSDAARLLASPRVLFADRADRQAKEELLVSGFDLGANRVNAVHNRYPLLTGEGMMVSVKENLFDTNDIDLKGRISRSGHASANVSGHASIMATMIGGAGNTFYEGKGVAWKTSLQSVTFANLLPEPETYYRGQYINVQNHSYGTGLENYYGADAAAYDALVVSNPSLLHVFSSGNSGTAASTGPYAGIAAVANLTGSFKMAKNIIAVGATDSVGNIELLSSRGPAYDGRIKPELVAFGQDGSSGAAAVVSGIALLLQQLYRQQHNDSLPHAALVKAVLINTADDAGTEGPDYAAGFGAVNAFRAVNSITRSNYWFDSVQQSVTKTFSFNIPAGVRSLKFTLVWTDPPATANAARALVNDVDLELFHASSGQTWKPWVLSSFAHKDSLQLPAVRGRDSLNNVEQVTIDDPVQGTYTIRVTGYRIAAGYQPFYIVYHADTANRFRWTYPMSGDPVRSGSSNMLRWENTYPANTTGQLAYSTDDGNNWQDLGAVDLSKKYTRWNAPDGFSRAILRMTIGNDVYHSDTFALSNPLVTAVGFNCTDSFLFYWNRPAGITNFRIYQLVDKFLEPLTITSDTFYIGSKAGVAAKHFTVTPVINDQEGIKALTFDYSTQGVGCYFKSFLTRLENNEGLLNLELGTLHRIQSIVVQKQLGSGFTTIQTLSALNGLHYVFTDPSLQQGVNTYRIALVLDDGRTLYSSSEVIYHLAVAPYVMYPNPAPAAGFVRILQREVSTVRVVIHDITGRKIRDEEHDELVISISTANMQKGLYIVTIWKDGKKDYIGKLIVN